MLYCDLAIDDVQIWNGVPCLHAVFINSEPYLNFSGYLLFADSNAVPADPDYTGLEDRFFLYYYPDLESSPALVPLLAVPSQQFSIVLGYQNCVLSFYERTVEALAMGFPPTTVEILQPTQPMATTSDNLAYYAQAHCATPYDGPYTYSWAFDDGTTDVGQQVFKTWTTESAAHVATVTAVNLATTGTAQASQPIQIWSSADVDAGLQPGICMMFTGTESSSQNSFYHGSQGYLPDNKQMPAGVDPVFGPYSAYEITGYSQEMWSRITDPIQLDDYATSVVHPHSFPPSHVSTSAQTRWNFFLQISQAYAKMLLPGLTDYEWQNLTTAAIMAELEFLVDGILFDSSKFIANIHTINVDSPTKGIAGTLIISADDLGFHGAGNHTIEVRSKVYPDGIDCIIDYSIRDTAGIWTSNSATVEYGAGLLVGGMYPIQYADYPYPKWNLTYSDAGPFVSNMVGSHEYKQDSGNAAVVGAFYDMSGDPGIPYQVFYAPLIEPGWLPATSAGVSSIRPSTETEAQNIIVLNGVNGQYSLQWADDVVPYCNWDASVVYNLLMPLRATEVANPADPYYYLKLNVVPGSALSY